MARGGPRRSLIPVTKSKRFHELGNMYFVGHTALVIRPLSQRYSQHWHTSGSAYFLLYCCCTIIAHTLWVRGLLLGVFFLLCCAVLPLYYSTYRCFTAVVCGGWADRFVGMSMGSCVFFLLYFSPRYTGPALAYFSVPLLILQSTVNTNAFSSYERMRASNNINRVRHTKLCWVGKHINT